MYMLCPLKNASVIMLRLHRDAQGASVYTFVEWVRPVRPEIAARMNGSKHWTCSRRAAQSH